MEDLLMNENVTSENAKNIILNQDFNVKKDRSFSESNENDLYYDLDDNYFSDCNLSEITKYKN